MNCEITQNIRAGADLIRQGEVVAFATETVYGLGANALNPEAVARIFEVKQRPHFDPLIVHISHIKQLDELTYGLSEQAEKLAEQFWPGPLTLVLPKRKRIPDLVTSGLDSVAIRIPAHPIAQQLLVASELPIAAPSANKFGCLSPTQASHVAEQLGNEIKLILDGGACTVGVESTVIQCTGEIPVLLRPGGISLEEIEQCVGPVRLAQIEDYAESNSHLSPGMLPKHYAPRTRLMIADQLNDVPTDGRKGLLSLFPLEETFLKGHQFSAQEILSPAGDLKIAAARLFTALRNLDAAGVDQIIALRMPENGLGRTINNRLERAAVS
ncbi:L-threonylcarbamoyladenylate synthase [Gimesia fumaroli]|uniref:Threonylcarbamoyl-AMP synthase n=1 Tax=Gimesia fumaroli TaxID=2527976 RepID=A0A518ILF5_9PLAN|nr:L-threonylcarbamoyladenylate synthase [Gimesia fumaroli]QDV53855.1 Threonylcarbamoyl-AMP synthase [Gimesia fumaroli]